MTLTRKEFENEDFTELRCDDGVIARYSNHVEAVEDSAIGWGFGRPYPKDEEFTAGWVRRSTDSSVHEQFMHGKLLRHIQRIRDAANKICDRESTLNEMYVLGTMDETSYRTMLLVLRHDNNVVAQMMREGVV